MTVCLAADTVNGLLQVRLAVEHGHQDAYMLLLVRDHRAAAPRIVQTEISAAMTSGPNSNSLTEGLYCNGRLFPSLVKLVSLITFQHAIKAGKVGQNLPKSLCFARLSNT